MLEVLKYLLATYNILILLVIQEPGTGTSIGTDTGSDEDSEGGCCDIHMIDIRDHRGDSPVKSYIGHST